MTRYALYAARSARRVLMRLWRLGLYRLHRALTRPGAGGERPDKAEVGRAMERLARRFEDDPTYFLYDPTNPWGYLFPTVGKAFDFLRAEVPAQGRVLDVCGGAGNLGLALSLEGHGGYVLADIDATRMRWGELLWRRYGRTLHWTRRNVLDTGFADAEFDAVALLGWENPGAPYTLALRECVRVLKPGGVFVFSYHDVEGIIEGNWDHDPTRHFSYLPYSISWPALELLCERLGLEILGREHAVDTATRQDYFPDSQPRVFPMYVVRCRLRGEG